MRLLTSIGAFSRKARRAWDKFVTVPLPRPDRLLQFNVMLAKNVGISEARKRLP